MSLTLGGITFHLYGFILGVAMMSAIFFAEQIAKREKISNSDFWNAIWIILVSGFIGARLYHVLTDLGVYWANPWRVFQVWLGGLSIIGGVIGAAIGTYIWTRKTQQKNFWVWSDLSVLALPVGQVIGRLGNWVNQELYGLPTKLPWGIPIDAVNRTAAYKQFMYFHPLFAYEMIGVTGIFALLWHLYLRGWKLGQGKLFGVYILGYSWLRICLDFVRIGVPRIQPFGLGINQCVLIIIAICVASWLLKTKEKILVFLAVFVASLIFCAIIFSMNQEISLSSSTLAVPQVSPRANQKLRVIQVNGKDFTVELAETPAEISRGLSGRSEIGADGMLFIFPQAMETAFWMKEMKFNIDIIWIYQNAIVGVEENTPAPRTPFESLPTYPSPQKVDAVLEVPAGEMSRQGWKIGTPVLIHPISQ